MKSFKMMAAVAVAGVCAMGAGSAQAGMFDWVPGFRPAPTYRSAYPYAQPGRTICGPTGCYQTGTRCVNGNCSNGCCVNGYCRTGQCANGQCANGQCGPIYGTTTNYRGGVYGTNCPGGVCPTGPARVPNTPGYYRPVNYQSYPYGVPGVMNTAPRANSRQVQQFPVNQVTQANLSAPSPAREPSPFYP